MSRSYEKIDYTLRPAKNIERKMMAEAFHRMRPICPIQDYRYVGMGATYYADFRLFHRSLGIRRMISIESADDEGRITFNRPYSSVEIRMGSTAEVLPSLPWRAKTIYWMDYDKQLNSSILQDVRTICANALSGSVLVVTLNAQPAEPGAKEPLDEFRGRIGKHDFPRDAATKDLRGSGVAHLYRRITNRVIESTLNNANGALPANSRRYFRQLFFFTYNDGTPMVTLGGLLYSQRQRRQVESIDFSDLPFVAENDEEFRIQVPNLTFREMRFLDQHLPGRNPAALARLAPVPEKDCAKYASLYRFFPSFVDADF